MKSKSYISLLLACLLGLHAWQLSLIVLNYEYNQEAFVRMFCENQDKPELHCNGQCFLKDSMEHAQHDEGMNGHEIKLGWSPLYMQVESYQNLKTSFYHFQQYFEYAFPNHQLLIPEGIFHPPQA